MIKCLEAISDLTMFHFDRNCYLRLLEVKGSIYLLNSIVQDVNAGPWLSSIQILSSEAQVLVNNLTLTNTGRSMGLGIEIIDSFTLTNSVLSGSETALLIGSKCLLSSCSCGL